MTLNYPYYGLPNYIKFINPNFQCSPQKPKYNSSFNVNPQASYSANSHVTSSYSNYNKSYYTRPKNQSESYKKITPNVFENSNAGTPFFSILGIDLYFDDILLLCIILFLYSENVEDPFLFIILIILLLS